MLTVEAFETSGKNPRTFSASRVLIRDGVGNPVCVVVVYVDGERPVTLVAHLGDDDFDTILQTFGTPNTVVLNHIHTD